MKPNDYLLDFNIRSQGLQNAVNTSNPMDLEWSLKAYRNEKSISYENRYTEIYFEHEDQDIDYTGVGDSEEEVPKSVVTKFPSR